MKERMSPILIAMMLLVTGVLIIIGWNMFFGAGGCDKTLVREANGAVSLLPSGRWFPDMNAYQQWKANEGKGCPMPIQVGGDKEVMKQPSDEQTYAKTPINKVDDYEFSRVFGVERDGKMEVNRQNFNVILNDRAFDWTNKPLSSDERRAKYAGLHEGFTATGDLTSVDLDDLTHEIISRYGEKSEKADSCDRAARAEDKKVRAMVRQAYGSDPEFAPVITKVGPHNWEVNELKQLRPNMEHEVEDNRVVDTANDAVDIAFDYRQAEDVNHAIDPFFPEKHRKHVNRSDPFYGPVKGMERMFGPTLDHMNWY